MSQAVLSLNCGSSSLKFAMYRMGAAEETLLAEGAVEGVGLPDCRLWAREPGQLPHESLKHAGIREHAAAVQALFVTLQELRLPRPEAVGHRVVHGGMHHAAPEPVGPALLEDLSRLAVYAPLHLPPAIAGIQAVSERYPELPQAACFDTGFHRSMPEMGQALPLPSKVLGDGVRRYGFHGISYEFVAQTLAAGQPAGRVIVAHLGNGASMVAVRDGQPLDTTMGFTPSGGFMMGSRSGDLDPGVLIHLMRTRGYDADSLERLVDREAGLLGVSERSPDMRALLAARDSDPRADRAIRLFCYQARKQIGAFTAVLGGLDTLVFTGGIGERAAPVRWEICEGLEYLGLRLDRRRNDAHADTVSADESACLVRVIPTNEDLIIARHTWRLLFPPRSA